MLNKVSCYNSQAINVSFSFDKVMFVRVYVTKKYTSESGVKGHTSVWVDSTSKVILPVSFFHTVPYLLNI